MERALLGIFMFMLLIASFILGVLTPLNPDLAENLARSVEDYIEDNIVPRKDIVELGIFIFSHNLIRALPMLIPVVGAIWGPIVLYITGIYSNAIMITLGVFGPEKLKIAGLALLTPSTILELVAYSLFSSESIAIFKYLRGERDYYLSYT
ncbi:MAG: hypothetical protein DRN53_00990, partial [Thermoprotei archaeon]